MNKYKLLLEQVDYPDGVKSHLTVVCTAEQARNRIGKLYPNNESWRIVDMQLIGAFDMQAKRQKNLLSD